MTTLNNTNDTNLEEISLSKGAKRKHYIIFFSCIVITWLVFKQLIFIQGHSLNASLAFLIPVKSELKNGDVVTFHYKHAMFDNDNKDVLLVKKVACKPKSTFEKSGFDFFCDGMFLGTAKKARQNGDIFPVFNYKGVIPEDSYFLLGDSLDSFDSRYVGFIKKADIENSALVIF